MQLPDLCSIMRHLSPARTASQCDTTAIGCANFHRAVPLVIKLHWCLVHGAKQGHQHTSREQSQHSLEEVRHTHPNHENKQATCICSSCRSRLGDHSQAHQQQRHGRTCVLARNQQQL